MHALVVDDNPDVVDLIIAFLGEMGEIDSAKDGEQAVGMVRKAIESGNPYNLICMDIKMPNKNGREAVNEIRQIEESCGITLGDGAKIIMTTALKDRTNVMGAFWNDGCDAYLVKPFGRADLLDTLKRLQLAAS